jgi:GNAT superfamily N-acetyltransferase
MRSSSEPWRWWADEPVPVIFFAAITLGSAPEDPGDVAHRADDLASALRPIEGRLAICDAWDRIDLSAYGYLPDEPQTWVARQPTAAAADYPPPAAGVRVVEVTDEGTLAEFEAVHNEGFGSRPTPPGTYYGPAILDDPRTRAIGARGADGRAVGTAMAHMGDEVLGIYSVSVLPTVRGRGIGWSLTQAALATAPGRIAVLHPSEEGASMYRRMGFEPFARFAVWARPKSAP